MNDPVVIGGMARTPMGSFQGVFADVKATTLGAAAVQAAVDRSGVDPALVEQCLMGCVLPDIYILESGLLPNEKFLVEGFQKVKEDDKVKTRFESPEQVLKSLKLKAD